MDRQHFMKRTKLVRYFSDFFIKFSEFCKIFVLQKKEKTEEKKKVLHGPAHNEGGPTSRIQLRLKKKPNRRATCT